MKRAVLAVLAGVFLAVLLAATGPSGAQEAGQPAQPPAEAPAQPEVKQTPQAAIDWYQKQLDRMEQQRRAAEMRQQMIQGGEASPQQPAQ